MAASASASPAASPPRRRRHRDDSPRRGDHRKPRASPSPSPSPDRDADRRRRRSRASPPNRDADRRRRHDPKPSEDNGIAKPSKADDPPRSRARVSDGEEEDGRRARRSRASDDEKEDDRRRRRPRASDDGRDDRRGGKRDRDRYRRRRRRSPSSESGSSPDDRRRRHRRDESKQTPRPPDPVGLLLPPSLPRTEARSSILYPMAPLLSPPLLADLVAKSHSSSTAVRCSGSVRRWAVAGLAGAGRRDRHRRRRTWGRRGFRVSAVATESRSPEGGAAEDYYAVLGVMPDATPQQIKKAYYNCMKACHPDLSGNDPDVTNFCMFINEVYTVLTDPIQRAVYDEINGYTATATNPFLDDAPKDHVFVDEFSCIGCKNCANVCSKVFEIEEDYGRARVYNQSGNEELIQEAIDSCPVDCIHWTSAAQVSLLEDEMRKVERVNVALMLSGMGSSFDVFRMASTRWEKRQAKVLNKVRMRMSQDDSNKGSSWSDIWGSPTRYQKNEEDTKERMKRAAAAARRWREYSRKGADKPPTFKLPEAASNQE